MRTLPSLSLLAQRDQASGDRRFATTASGAMRLRPSCRGRRGEGRLAGELRNERGTNASVLAVEVGRAESVGERPDRLHREHRVPRSLAPRLGARTVGHGLPPSSSRVTAETAAPATSIATAKRRRAAGRSRVQERDRSLGGAGRERVAWDPRRKPRCVVCAFPNLSTAVLGKVPLEVAAPHPAMVTVSASVLASAVAKAGSPSSR